MSDLLESRLAVVEARLAQLEAGRGGPTAGTPQEVARPGADVHVAPVESRTANVAVGNGRDTNFFVKHGLGTKNVAVSVFSEATGADVQAGVRRVDLETVELSFNKAPTAGEFHVVIIG
jgi:hypothetical protein